MFTNEIKELLIQVIGSWQVIAATVVVVLYFFLVSYVARLRHRRRTPRSVNPSKSKKNAAPEPAHGGGSDTNDELGLEE
jgi:hypothetical protein